MSTSSASSPKKHVIPPHLYAKVMSKKHGRADELSVSSFADLSMYQAGSSLEEVVRKKQPVTFGPANQRGRRPGHKQKYPWEEHPHNLGYSIKMPIHFVSQFLAGGAPAPISPKVTLLDTKGLDLSKFRDVPHGIGLREQLMGDFEPRPIKNRGRPRKDIPRGHHFGRNEPSQAQEAESGDDNGVGAEVLVDDASLLENNLIDAGNAKNMLM